MQGLYTLMCKDVPVCILHYDPAIGLVHDIVQELNPEWCPPSAFDGSHIDALYLGYWWMSRLAPAGRLPRYLQQRPLFARLFTDNHGLSLSDQYWILPTDDSQTRWADINFFDNAFDETVGRDLLGTCNRSSLYQSERMNNPSFWSNGMLRKYWRISPTGIRQLCKASSAARNREALNEYAVTQGLGALFGENCNSYVRYALEHGTHGSWSICNCFTDASHEFVPVAGVFYGDTLTYGHDAWRMVLSFIEDHEIPNAIEQLSRMMFADCLFGNIDRHFGNFGFLRNTDTLVYEDMAPIFDCGTSLWCDPKAPLFAPFAENLNYQADLIRDASWVDWGRTEQAAERVVDVLSSHGIDSKEASSIRSHLQAQIDVLQDAL